DYMANQENKVAPLLRKLRATRTGLLSLTATEDEVLSGYIALTYARSAHWRRSSPERQRTAWATVAKQLEDRDALELQIRATGRASARWRSSSRPSPMRYSCRVCLITGASTMPRHSSTGRHSNTRFVSSSPVTWIPS